MTEDLDALRQRQEDAETEAFIDAADDSRREHAREQELIDLRHERDTLLARLDAQQPHELSKIDHILVANLRAENERLQQRLDAQQQELGKAHADVVRMATTKVGEKCEHHKSSLEALEYLALKECPICWKVCAEGLQQRLDAVRITLLSANQEILNTGGGWWCKVCGSVNKHSDGCALGRLAAVLTGEAKKIGEAMGHSGNLIVTGEARP